MRIDASALIAILAMGMVTYGTRVGGLLMMSRINLAPRTERWLQQIPGAVLVSLVAPVVLSKGLPETLASGATVLAAIRTGNLLVAMVVGVAAVWALRGLIG